LAIVTMSLHGLSGQRLSVSYCQPVKLLYQERGTWRFLSCSVRMTFLLIFAATNVARCRKRTQGK